MAEISNKTTALNNAVSQIEKQFGKGSIMKLGGKEVVQIPAISSGSIALDIISGIGGFPRGRVIEIYGPEGSGKTTLALHAIAEAQKAGGYAAFIDVEHALDPLYAQKLGVNIDELYIAQPDWGEQALEIAEILVRSGGVDIIVVDSVAALVPKAELEGDMGDSHMGLQARLMSQALRKLTAIIARSKTTFVFLNQLREKIGMFVGNPEITTGGRALKFYASMRIEVKRTMAIKEGTDIVGGRVRIKIVKNKMAPPFKEVEVDLYYGRGFSKESDIIELGVLYDILKKTGAWYSYGDNRLGNGKEAVRKLFEENRALFDEVKSKILEKSAPVLKEKEKDPD
jgi:recombination protein RecA